MEIIFGPRQNGKTMELIKRSNGSRAVIVTATHKRAEAVKQMAKELQIDIPDPICIDSLMHQTRSWGVLNNGHILINDADDVLKSICAGYKIDAITMTDRFAMNTKVYY